MILRKKNEVREKGKGAMAATITTAATHARQSFMKTVPSATPPKTKAFPWWHTAAWPCLATRTSSCR